TAHTLSPLLGVVWWARYVPWGALRPVQPVVWLGYPIAYLAYWLVRGPIVGEYPYFFIDVNELGYDGVAVWSGILIAGFLVLGGMMLGVDRVAVRRAAVAGRD
ncbi:MAG: Pr6Pr family membrane protein, partial [Nitriliruptoraceae bacterium]